jgi:hypothetical protein
MIGSPKKILGALVGWCSRADAAEWLEALNRAAHLQFPGGIKETENLELNLMNDNGSAATSTSFMREVSAPLASGKPLLLTPIRKATPIPDALSVRSKKN